MPKINAIRVVNYRYNDGKRIWLDEIFDFKGGHNALITLQNGGGKTVLIQGIMQAINPNISLRKREWKGFFTKEGVPTYILVEWLLDDGVSYATTGVGFQLKQSKMDSYMFITNYKGPTEYDIRSLKLTEEFDQRMMFTPLSDFKKRMGDLRQNCVSKGLSMAIRTFNIQRDYRQGLQELNINPNEWKVMMRKINEAEGGMNEVFENTVTTERVVRELILPQVEQKLIQQSETSDTTNSSPSLFKETHLQLNGLVEEKVKLEEKINAKERILMLNELIEQDLLPQKEIYQNYLNQKETHLIQTVRLEMELNKATTLLNEEQDQLEQDCTALENEEHRYYFEKKSHEYHQTQEKCQAKEDECVGVEIQLNESKQSVAKAVELKNQLEAAYYYHRKKQYKQRCLAKEEMVRQLQAKDVDLEAQLKETGGNIRFLIEEELKQIDTDINATKVSLSQTENELDTVKDKQKNEQKQLTELKVSLLMSEKLLNQTEDDIERILTKYPSWRLLDQTLTTAEQLLTQTTQQHLETQETYETLIQQWETLLKRSGETVRQQTEATFLMKETQRQAKRTEEEQIRFLKQKNQMYERLKEVYQDDSLEVDVVYQKEEHLEYFSDLIETNEQTFMELKQQEIPLRNELMRLNKGSCLELPAEFLEFLDDHQIAYQTGFDFLSNYESSDVATISQSILAHALILTQRDLEQLRQIDYPWETDFIIPLINRDQLLDWLATQEDGMMSSQGMLEIVSYFNPEWLDEDYLEQQREKLMSELTEIRQEIEFIQREKIYYSRILTELEWFNLTQKEENLLEEERQSLEEKLMDLDKEIHHLDQTVELLTKEKEVLKEDIQATEKTVNTLAQEIQVIQSFQSLIETKLKTTQTKKETTTRFQAVETELKMLLSQIETLESSIALFKENIREKESLNKQLKIEAITYQNYHSKATEQSKEFLIQLFVQLKGNRSDQELTVLEGEIKELNREIHECESTIAKLPLNSTDYCEMSIDSLSHSIEQEKVVNQKRSEEQEILSQYVKLTTEIKGLTESLEKAHQEILDTYQQEPQQIELIDTDFKTRSTILKNQKNRLQETTKQLKARESELSKKDRELTRLLDLAQPEELQLIKTHFTSDEEMMDVSLETTDLTHLFEQLSQIYRFLTLIRNKWNDRIETVFDSFDGYSLFTPLLDALRQLDDLSPDYLLNCCQVFERQLTKNEATLNKLEKDLGSLEDMFYEFKRDCCSLAKNIYDEIKLFGKGINIQWKGVRQQLIQLKAPQPTVDLESTMDQYVSDTLDVLISLYHEGKLKELEDQVINRFNVDAFLNLLTPIQSYKLSIFKIEIQHEQSAYKPWEDLVVKASGGERFFASFVLSAAILTYSRFDRTLKDISKMGKVLLMDNPFGVVTSQHLLEPVFELSRKLNIQMLCLTGISEIGIYDNFDLVYALKVEGLTPQLSKIEMSTLKVPEENVQTFYYYKQPQLF